MEPTNLIQVKKTKNILMFHSLETGDVIIQLIDNEGTIANQMTIPGNKVKYVKHGFEVDGRRFYKLKKHESKSKTQGR